MIDKLRGIAIFSTVVDQGTFRGAALHLGLAPSRVSEVVSDLEADLGVTLLYRSTRQLSLTQEGRVLHEQAQTMLRSIETGLDAVNPTSKNPSGALRITAPAFITQTHLMDRFADFARIYPKVSLSFDFSDAQRDIIHDGFDISIRAGWLADSDLMSRNIGHAERLLVASPDYAANKGVPSHPRDLEAWDWVRFSIRPDLSELHGPNGARETVAERSNLVVNSATALYEFAIRGRGVTGLPASLARRAIEKRELVHVLPAWSLSPLGIHAVWPDRSRRENLTTLFVRHVANDPNAPKAAETGDP